ncbi:hypothetical protein D3C71_448640 [compost metagenome]
MDLVKEAIQVTLKTVEGSPEEWLNPSDGILTRFVNENKNLRAQIDLELNEEPIFEFCSQESYSLITSKRVISIRNAVYNEKIIMEIDNVRPLIPDDYFENPKPKKMLRIIDFKKDEFLIEFDKGVPLYFADILLTNLVWQLQKGKWFLNPSK